MLKSQAKWKFIEKQTILPTLLEDTSNLSPTVLQLLQQRGLKTVEEVKQFISPNLARLHDPKNLSMIDIATKRIHDAIAHDEKVLIFGDYDADGVSSTALLWWAFKELGVICDFYIPNRFTEGYGLNEQAIRDAHDNKYKVIVTVDTGIASFSEAELAKKLGVDLIITDHHEVQEELPEAFAIINPKCSPNYEFSELAGVGVAFKFAQQLLGYFPEHLLDFVAIGTIADLVPLVDENRIFAFHGLQHISNTKNIGLQALKKVCQLPDNITEEHIGFSIGPRLNAVGRIRNASLAVELLITEDFDEAEAIANKIQSINEERQQIVSKIVREAEKLTSNTQADNVIVVAQEGWNEGVLGIVASRLVRKYNRPAIVLTIKPDEGIVKGSARSIPNFNLFESCMNMKSLFTQFGGHSQAAGMTLPFKNISKLRELLNIQINNELTEEDFKQIIEINDTVDISAINEELILEINQLAPFGMSNPKPVFRLTSQPTDIRQIGSLKNHLKLMFKENNVTVEGIGFTLGEIYPHISTQDQTSIVGELGINEWNGIRKPQMIIQDISVDEWQLFDHRGKNEPNISPYLSLADSALVISEDISKLNKIEGNHCTKISYNTDINTLSTVDTLFVYDLPPELIKLQDIIMRTQPSNIHLMFKLENSKYLQPIPTRQDFKWFYSFIAQHQAIDLRKATLYIIKTKNWTKEFVTFITHVFLDLNFVEIKDNILTLQPSPTKRSIESSKLYQDLLREIKIEKTLYYSNYSQLKAWFSNQFTSEDSAKEEIVHGL